MGFIKATKVLIDRLERLSEEASSLEKAKEYCKHSDLLSIDEKNEVLIKRLEGLLEESGGEEQIKEYLKIMEYK